VEKLQGVGGRESYLRSAVAIYFVSRKELSQKRLELFREAVPSVARVAVLIHPSFPAALAEMKARTGHTVPWHHCAAHSCIAHR
jgi:ABC-type uncharacterized transport system substrate-binding protein